MENIGWASLQIVPSLKGFESKVAAGTAPGLASAGRSGGAHFGTQFATRARSSIHEKFKESAKFIVGPLIGAFAVEKVGELIGESISGAEDLAKSQNRLDLIFGRSADTVDRFGEHAAKTYGLSDLSARKAAASIGLLGRQAGLSNDENAKFSIHFSKIASDLASFNNVDPSVTLSALTKGLAGATRGLKPFGILIDSSQQKAEALRLGLLKPVKDGAKIHAAQVAVLNDQKAYNDSVAKSGKGSLDSLTAQAKLGTAQKALQTAVEGTLPPLTAQQKVLANASLIQQQASKTQGDFGKSSGDLANQQRILSASISNAKDRLGKGLLPIATDFVGFINRKGLPVIDQFSHWFEHDGADGIQHFAHEAKPLATSILPAVGTGLKDITGVLRGAAPAAKKVFDAFNSLPDWAQKAVVLGGAAGIIAKKSGLLGVGKNALTGGGGLGSLATLAKPLPVFVVNEGFGGAAGGGGGLLGDAKKGIPLLGGLTAGTAAAWGAAGAAVGLASAKGFQLSHTNALLDGPFGLNTLADHIGSGALHIGSKPQEGTGAVKRFFDEAPLTSTTTKVDAFNQRLKRASTGLDLVSHAGSHAFRGLSSDTDAFGNKIQGAVTRTDILEGRLRRFPKVLRTELDLDTRRAERNLATLRAHAGRHINAELSIELAGRSPQQTNLDGVRRSR